MKYHVGGGIYLVGFMGLLLPLACRSFGYFVALYSTIISRFIFNSFFLSFTTPGFQPGI